MMDDEYGIWGKADGKGPVIRSEASVDFHPINKIGNVVRVNGLDDAVRYVIVATQTIGFYPEGRMAEFRDRLGAGGAQRVAGWAMPGRPPSAIHGTAPDGG